MVKLPIWVMNQNKPAIYDSESATAIEMVAKVYGAMQELIDEYNKFAESCNTKINEFESDSVEEYNTFKTALRQEFQDFIDVIDLKYSSLDIDVGSLKKEVDKVLADATTKIENAVEFAIDSIVEQKGNSIANKYETEKSIEYEIQNSEFEIPLTKGAKEKKTFKLVNIGSESIWIDGVFLIADGWDTIRYTNSKTVAPGGVYEFTLPESDTGNPEELWENGRVFVELNGDSYYSTVNIVMPELIDVEDCYRLITSIMEG